MQVASEKLNPSWPYFNLMAAVELGIDKVVPKSGMPTLGSNEDVEVKSVETQTEEENSDKKRKRR